MTELTLQLPDKILERLQSEAERQQTPLTEVVLTAIERYLDEDDPMIGLFSGPTDLSVKAKQLLQDDITSSSGWTHKSNE